MNASVRTERGASRHRLAVIARTEAGLQLAGDANRAGPAIERYLAVFREAMNLHGSTTEYSDLKRGYHWCCAFVYYCCLQAGFRFPPKPVASARCTLAAVPSWREWAALNGFYHPASSAEPEIGDLALYNHVYNGNPLDHIGVIVGSVPGGVLSAEGYNANRSGLFPRTFPVIDGYVRLPEKAYPTVG
jgi:hypothetical protein